MTASSSSQVCFDSSIEGIDPQSVHRVSLRSGAVMPVAAFGTFHSDWAQDYMKDATVEAIRGDVERVLASEPMRTKKS